MPGLNAKGTPLIGYALEESRPRRGRLSQADNHKH